jgi:hypothetical protein
MSRPCCHRWIWPQETYWCRFVNLSYLRAVAKRLQKIDDQLDLDPDASPLPENAATHYHSLFHSYPLMLSKPSDLSSSHTSLLLSSSADRSVYSSSDTGSLSSSGGHFDRFALPIPDLGPLKMATASKIFDPSKKVCQYEVPGGGICKDSSCDDIHLSRLVGSQTQTGLELSGMLDSSTVSF